MSAVLSRFRLNGRLALVTGSSQGIGLSIARGLAEAGARVVLNGRDARKVNAAVDQLRADKIDATAAPFDVTDTAGLEASVGQIETKHGAIDILVNNAGMTRRGPMEDLDDADWRAVVGLNLDSVFYLTKQVARRMIPRRRGAVINICSVMSEVARPTIVPYAASKGGAKMLTKAMAVDLGRHGIRVNGIGPGYFETELNAPLMADPAFNGWLTGRTPLDRWGRLEELQGAAVYLASDAASFVTGHILYVDGGVTARL